MNLRRLEGFGPAMASQGLAFGVQTPEARSVPLVPYNGKNDLGAFLTQFNCVACCHGWDQTEGGVNLVAAFHGGGFYDHA